MVSAELDMLLQQNSAVTASITGGDFRYVKKMMVKWCCKKTTVRANWQVADAQRFVLKISIT